MKIAILDNDKYFCDKIKQLIIDNSYVSGFDIDMYESPRIFLENRNKYDILFLEIDLLEIDGIDIVRKLKSNQIIIVVVTNSYDRITEVIGINVAGYIIKNQIINIDKIAFMVGMNIKLKYSDMIVEVSRRKRREVFELMIRAINRI